MLPILLILFAIAGLSLSIFLILLLFSSPKKCRFPVDDDQSIEVVKFVEAHREILPICPVQGWCLISSYCGIRCWKRDLSFTVTGLPIDVYGCSKIINCSAVIVLNVIADISTWPEWDILTEGQTIHPEVSEDPSLHGDQYMQCDQLVVTSTIVNTTPEVVMYRFGNLESNGVGWILLWDAKKLDWTFFLAQPVDRSKFPHGFCENPSSFTQIQQFNSDLFSPLGKGDELNNSDEKCLLTAVWGFDHNEYSDGNFPDRLCAKVQNLSDAIANSQYKIRPFLPLIQSHLPVNNPHFPAIHSALNDLPEKPCVLLELEKARETNILQNCVLAVVPILSESSTSNKILGFTLTSRFLKKSFPTVTTSLDAFHSDEKRRSRRRQKVRSDSMTACSPRLKSLELEGRRSSSLSAPIRRNKPPELTITEVDSESKMPAKAASHSLLNLIFPSRRSSDASEKGNKSPGESRNTTPPTNRKKLKKTSSASSQEDLISATSQHHSHLSPDKVPVHSIGHSNSETKKMASKSLSNIINKEFADSAFQMLSSKGESGDYASLGEYCISVILKENSNVALIDINTSEDEQSVASGGWMFKELNKNITVFKKFTLLSDCNIISYLCEGIIPASRHIIWKTLCNPLTRFMYDDTVKKISVLAELPNKQKLIHMYNESVTLLKKEVQDFCLLQTEKIEEEKMILAFHSVEDQLCPVMKDVIRGTIIASGWIIEEVSGTPDVSLVSYLTQMVVSSPEINLMEEICNVQCQCINNLSAYLSTRPP